MEDDEILEQVVLTGTHSLICSHIPSNLQLKPEVGSNGGKDISKFGFWSDAPQFNTYYPEAKPEDFNPAEADFIQPLFRVLSNTVVISNMGLIEFPVDVLKAAVSKLPGQALYPNHDSQVGNELGVVLDTVWQDSYKIGDLTIPAGINGRVKIDAKSNPRLARGIMMNPPSIHSVSCTVVYKWVKSHNFEKDWEFYDKMGTYGEDGQLVRKIATEIVYFTELSLVTGGADPFAKKLDDNGKIILPDFAKAQEVKPKVNMSYSRDWSKLGEYGEASFSKSNINTKTENQMTLEELLSMIGTTFGINSVSADNVKAKLEKIKQGHENLVDASTLKIGDIVGFDAIKESFTKMKKEIDEYKTKEQFIKAGEEHLAHVKEEAVRFYKLSLKEGQKEDENIIALINGSDLNQAVALEKQYHEMVDEKAPLTCASCGSHEISRASFKKKDDNDTEGKTGKTGMSYEEIKEKMVDQVYMGLANDNEE